MNILIIVAALLAALVLFTLVKKLIKWMLIFATMFIVYGWKQAAGLPARLVALDLAFMWPREVARSSGARWCSSGARWEQGGAAAARGPPGAAAAAA